MVYLHLLASPLVLHKSPSQSLSGRRCRRLDMRSTHAWACGFWHVGSAAPVYLASACVDGTVALCNGSRARTYLPSCRLGTFMVTNAWAGHAG